MAQRNSFIPSTPPTEGPDIKKYGPGFLTYPRSDSVADTNAAYNPPSWSYNWGKEEETRRKKKAKKKKAKKEKNKKETPKNTSPKK